MEIAVRNEALRSPPPPSPRAAASPSRELWEVSYVAVAVGQQAGVVSPERSNVLLAVVTTPAFRHTDTYDRIPACYNLRCIQMLLERLVVGFLPGPTPR